ncbi:MAG: hypothetical protein WD739_11460 [Actinomycetota bacterium]
MPGTSGELAIVDVALSEGVQRYSIPIDPASDHPLLEPAVGSAYWPALVSAIADGASLAGAGGRLEAAPDAIPAIGPTPSRRITTEQVNTSIVLGERVVLKLYRRLFEGVHPEPEVNRELRRIGSERVPVYRGSLVYRGKRGGSTAVAFVQDLIREAQDLWVAIRQGLEATLTEAVEPKIADGVFRDVRAGARGLGELSRDLGDAFGRRQADADTCRVWRTEARELSDTLGPAFRGLLPDDELLAIRGRLAGAIDKLLRAAGSPITRIHGDLHASQMCIRDGAISVVDFEGSPFRPLDRRREPDSPLRDLAGYLLSLEHIARLASEAAGRGVTGAFPDEAAVALWHAGLEAYEDEAGGIDRRLLDVFVLLRECQELLFATRVLPSWLPLPRATLRRMLSAS